MLVSYSLAPERASAEAAVVEREGTSCSAGGKKRRARRALLRLGLVKPRELGPLSGPRQLKEIFARFFRAQAVASWNYRPTTAHGPPFCPEGPNANRPE